MTPVELMKMPDGLFIAAAVAFPPSPLKPAEWLPTTVEMFWADDYDVFSINNRIMEI